MTELIADLFVSADGYANGSRSPAHFGFGGSDLLRWIDDEMRRPQRILLGRRTYQALNDVPEVARDDGWRRLTMSSAFVFSRTLREVSWPNAIVVGDDVVTSVRELKRDGGADLRTMGSLSLVHQLLRAQLVDHLRLVVFPLIIGETGREPAFEELPDIGLELASHSVLDGRVVVLDYAPRGAPPYS